MTAWLPYVWAAIVIAATAGFGYGTAAFLSFAVGVPASGWWAPLVQAHGHLQVFGWGGLMVLGVGFFFLPRLRGAPLAVPGALPWVLVTMAGGLALRGVGEPWAALEEGPLPRLALVGSGILEAGGATLAVAALALTARLGPPLQQRRGLVPVLPYLVLGFACFWMALGLNAVLMILSALSGYTAAIARGDEMVFRLGLEGFLVPISVAVAARSFPLFLWLRVPAPGTISLPFWPLTAGVVLRGIAPVANLDAAAVGAILEGFALVALTMALGVIPLRRREGMTPESDPHYLKPAEYLLVPAFGWLALAGLILVGEGISLTALGRPLLPPDVERHALGAGFITLLILGMGQRMLPGFAGRDIWSRGMVWWTALLGNASVILRVSVPAAAAMGWIPAGMTVWVDGALAISGILGLMAVLAFGVNLWKTFDGPTT